MHARNELVRWFFAGALSVAAGCGGDATSAEDAGGGGSTVDAQVPEGTDAASTANPDAAFDGTGACALGDPLAEPIAGCTPTPIASTGDPHEDCVRRINQFRCECQHLQPLARWRDGEACADQMAQYDSEQGSAHAGFSAGICEGGWGQNECPGWGSVEQTIEGCLQQMWDEGPGDFYGPPPHGHYLNMSSTSFTEVACGFYEGSDGVWAAQNFR